MKTVSWTELRNHPKRYFDATENGETIAVCRRGKPVALLSPFGEKTLHRWKQANPQRITGVKLSEAILAERRVSQ